MKHVVATYLVLLTFSPAFAASHKPAFSKAEIALITKARFAVRSALKDPESARFSAMNIARNGAVVCGVINAKNSFGGYVGKQMFAYLVKIDEVVMENPTMSPSDQLERLQLIGELCQYRHP
jgi:hypothetical protein